MQARLFLIDPWSQVVQEVVYEDLDNDPLTVIAKEFDKENLKQSFITVFGFGIEVITTDRPESFRAPLPSFSILDDSQDFQIFYGTGVIFCVDESHSKITCPFGLNVLEQRVFC